MRIRYIGALVAIVVTLAALGTAPASADVVVGDRIDVSGVTGHQNGTQTFAVSYRCTGSYADLWIKTRQLDGLHQVKVFGHGALGAAPNCDGGTHTANVTVAAIAANQWLTGGQQYFWGFFCDSLAGDLCHIDTVNDATINGSTLVLGGKGGVPPAIPDDIVILSTVDHSTGEVHGTYVCPTGASHVGLGGQIFQDQGLLNPTRVDFSWDLAMSPACDGAQHEFTATATPDVAGHTLTRNDPATSSAAFVVAIDTRDTGSDMQINKNGNSYASAGIA